MASSDENLNPGVTGFLPADLQTDKLNIDIDEDGVKFHFDWSDALFTRKEKSQIVEEMVKPIEEGLYNATPYDPDDPGFKRGSSTKKLFGKNVKHLREGITHQPNQFVDGSTQLGFKQGYYPVAFWTDRGTINQKGTFWFETYANNLPAQEAFDKAQAKAAEIYGGKKK
ncbi:MAG: hypothetical protein [Caudoviricetes sp.]|nr:MAG: hypothetical protein [Caudoviricetes sp.]